MRKDGVEIDHHSYCVGHDDGRDDAVRNKLVISTDFLMPIVLVLVCTLALCIACKIGQVADESYAMGQKDAYNGVQHFSAITKKTTRVTEWHDNREEAK